MNVAESIAEILKQENATNRLAIRSDPCGNLPCARISDPRSCDGEGPGPVCTAMTDARSRTTSGIGVVAMLHGTAVETACGAHARAFGESWPVPAWPMAYPRRPAHIPPRLRLDTGSASGRRGREATDGRPGWRNRPSARAAALDPVLRDPYRPRRPRCKGRFASPRAGREPAVPICTGLGGKAAFREDRPLCPGTGGVPLRRPVRAWRDRADLIFEVGCSVAEAASNVALLAERTILRAMPDPLEHDPDAPSQVGLAGGGGLAPQAMTGKPVDEPIRGRSAAVARIARESREWTEEWLPALTGGTTPLDPDRVLRDLQPSVVSSDIVLAHDVGGPHDRSDRSGPFRKSAVPRSCSNWGRTAQRSCGDGGVPGERGCPTRKRRASTCRARRRSALQARSSERRCANGSRSSRSCSTTSRWSRRSHADSEMRNPNAWGLGSSQIASLRSQCSGQEGPIEPWRHDCSATQTEKISPVVAGSAAWDHRARWSSSSGSCRHPPGSTGPPTSPATTRPWRTSAGRAGSAFRNRTRPAGDRARKGRSGTRPAGIARGGRRGHRGCPAAGPTCWPCGAPHREAAARTGTLRMRRSSPRILLWNASTLPNATIAAGTTRRDRSGRSLGSSVNSARDLTPAAGARDGRRNPAGRQGGTSGTWPGVAANRETKSDGAGSNRRARRCCAGGVRPAWLPTDGMREIRIVVG